MTIKNALTAEQIVERLDEAIFDGRTPIESTTWKWDDGAEAGLELHAIAHGVLWAIWDQNPHDPSVEWFDDEDDARAEYACEVADLTATYRAAAIELGARPPAVS